MAIKDNMVKDVLFQRLQPLAVSKYWSLIQQCLLDSLSGHKAAQGYQQRLMAAVQADRIQAWSAIAKGDAPVLMGMVFTQKMIDPLLGTAELLIYGLTLKAQMGPEAYAHCLAELEAYAKASGCHSLRAQTKVNGVKRLLESNGWSNGVCTLTKEI